MADVTSSWRVPHVSGHIDPNEKLFLFGYSCKLFPYDEKADYIDKGKHLIPWMGDKTLMIDRYDVRGYLHDLKQHEAKPGNYDDTSEEEKLIDEERYRSLRTDMTEEQLYQEEELKRLRAAIAGDGDYHEIAFTYDNPTEEKEAEPLATKFEDPEDDLYQAPEGLKIPKGIELPYNMKIHAIIEKTANFISEQGGQMEIIIKMKQHANPQFAFMHLDNPLHPYYKHLVKEIKSGAYKPVQTKKGYDTSSLVQRVSRSEDEDDDGHYLHPSLMSGKANDVPEFTVPTINFRRSHDDSYSLLVRNLKQHLVEESPSEPTTNEVFEQDTPADSENKVHNEYYNDDGTLNEYGLALHNHHIVPPPPDIQPVVNKMAEYVAKNGEDFEIIVKSKKDKRFDFLYPGNEYYDYYIYKRENSKVKIAENEASNIPSQTSSVAEDSKTGVIPFISSGDSNVESKETDLTKNENMASQNVENTNEGSSDSLDFLNSPSDIKEDSKSKALKVMKGPISFSLKVRENEASPDITKLTPLMLDDDSDGSEESQPNNKQKNSTEEASKNSRAAEVEVKAQKPINEVLEAKHAEERIKDKLLATARERLALQRKEKQLVLEQQKRAEQHKKEKQLHLDQQRKEKELQLERKRKAALFLKMLKGRNPDSNPTTLKGAKSKEERKAGSPDFWTLPDTSGATSPESGILFPLDKIIISTHNVGSSLIPGIKTEWSPEPHSEESATEEISRKTSDKLSSDSDSARNTFSKQEQKKKKRKKSRSRSRDRSRTSRRTKDRHRSRSPPRHYKVPKREKEKQLPAAYANVNRSRSRSRSPRRYRSVPNWRRR